MKTILKLMGTLVLTIGATTSVVACGDTPTPIISMNAVVAKQLGLTTDDAGETGTQAASLVTKNTDDIIWTMDALTTAITANKLLTTDNKDYAITAGTFNFQFANGTTKLGDNYTINLKTDAAVGVIATTLGRIANTLAEKDTNVVTNANILFVLNGHIPATAVKGAVINITGTTTISVKQFIALNKLTNLKITAQLESHTGANTWASGDTLTISYKTTTVNFDAATVHSTLTMS